MITKIPNESKYCVSYGQLNGCYWTVPATSTQGTTKEGDKDYIARVALSPNMDLELHKKVFLDFVNSYPSSVLKALRPIIEISKNKLNPAIIMLLLAPFTKEIIWVLFLSSSIELAFIIAPHLFSFLHFLSLD